MTPNQEGIVNALRLAVQYLAKAEADGLLQDCVRPVGFALRRVEEAVTLAEAEFGA